MWHDFWKKTDQYLDYKIKMCNASQSFAPILTQPMFKVAKQCRINHTRDISYRQNQESASVCSPYPYNRMGKTILIAKGNIAL